MQSEQLRFEMDADEYEEHLAWVEERTNLMEESMG
jgi:hypothetical protein